MMRNVLLFLVVCFTALSSAFAQSDSEMEIAFPIFKLGGGVVTSEGDLTTRFGIFGALSFSGDYKFASGFTAGVDFHQYFTRDVDQVGLMQNLINSNNQVLDVQGQAAIIQLQGRAVTVTANVGYIFPIKHENSGIWLKTGVGYFKHKLRIEHQTNEIRQLEEEYLKGYDRLTRGIALTPFLGYMHMSKNRRINWFAGFEATLGFTDPIRPINFDTQLPDADNRFDVLAGFHVGWVLPIRQRSTSKEYFN